MPRPSWSARPAALLRGLTLIELMVGIAILVVLATLAAPSFLRQIHTARLSAASSDLMATLARARGEAIRRGQRITVCRSQDGSTCSTDAAQRWDTGWLVFQDTNANSALDTGEAVLSRTPAAGTQLLVRGNLAFQDRIFFRPSGEASGNGTLRVCSTASSLPDAERARDLVVIRTGRVVLTTPAAVSSACEAKS
ncbi:GspH/FimT family pseudopilin [Ramlibacter rhizophilus]|uniref:Type II secretion system protein H n=1 Tax=Ramlibacter rhizophilus TaxID=1781167 RepID=A0A4Z0C387_9BURK|nr:GspH/FimT family pseudopilin [Ramlibacter rhizophilus]TFZ04659.1 prepilin-type N-terminal cleavage/methylation domain-containing protein [Ramlibacter rhizophilus]